MSSAADFSINPNLIQQEIDGELVLLNPVSGQSSYLDTVSNRTWELMQEFPNTEAIKQQMMIDFEVSEETLDKDLENFFAELNKIGLIVRI